MPRAQWGNFESDPFGAELDEFDVYEGEAPRGTQVFRLWMKILRLKTNRNGEPMLSFLYVVKEPKGSPKAKYNGYSFWTQQNVTEQGSKFINNWLEALAGDPAKGRALRRAFWDQKVMLDKEDPPNIVSIGTKKIKDQEIFVKASCKYKPASGDFDEGHNVLRYLPDDGGKAAKSEPAAEEDEGWEDTEADTDTDDTDGDGDEEYDERAEELEGMTLAELKKILKDEHSYKVAALRPLKTVESAVEEILGLEFPEDEEDAEEDEPESEEEDDEEAREAREAELAELSTVKLKSLARKLGAQPAELRGLDDEMLIEHILGIEFPQDAQEPEEEKPAAKTAVQRPVRGRAGRRKATAADDDEPPF